MSPKKVNTGESKVDEGQPVQGNGSVGSNEPPLDEQQEPAGPKCEVSWKQGHAVVSCDSLEDAEEAIRLLKRLTVEIKDQPKAEVADLHL